MRGALRDPSAIALFISQYRDRIEQCCKKPRQLRIAMRAMRNLRQCGDDGGDFNDMWNAIISLFSITVSLYQGDFREIQPDPMLLTMIYLFLLVSVVLLLNLLIAQLNQTYEYINKDVLGFARLNRASLVVDAMASCPKSKWKKFLAEARWHPARRFLAVDTDSLTGPVGCGYTKHQHLLQPQELKP